jgi:hypothetical protein
VDTKLRCVGRLEKNNSIFFTACAYIMLLYIICMMYASYGTQPRCRKPAFDTCDDEASLCGECNN